MYVLFQQFKLTNAATHFNETARLCIHKYLNYTSKCTAQFKTSTIYTIFDFGNYILLMPSDISLLSFCLLQDVCGKSV